jgi:hypothetical protein
MSEGTWILERCAVDNFPFRIQILREGEPWIALRAQDRWPAAGKNIFCLRESRYPEPDEVLEEIERVPILAFHERGPRLSVVLDRKRYKRCDFLFLTKQYKHSPDESYEQIFWLTQTSIKQHRPTAKLTRYSNSKHMCVRISSDERYPWRFSGASIERKPLPVGEYALMDGNDMLAVVERKTMDNLLADFGIMPSLHQTLAELATYEYNTLVIEALYSDFLNPRKLIYYSAGFCARAIGELYALHPRLNIVFCANRKIANEWTRNYFSAIWQLKNGT